MKANKLYLAQHGLAQDKTENPVRPLSSSGIKQTELVATLLANTNLAVSNIFHSGKLRAKQTAEIFAASLNVSTVSVSGFLSPNDDVSLITQQLNVNDALYIGHLPHLEKLVSFLVTDKVDQNIIKFHNSGVICLEKQDERYSIQWYITPDLLAG